MVSTPCEVTVEVEETISKLSIAAPTSVTDTSLLNTKRRATLALPFRAAMEYFFVGSINHVKSCFHEEFKIMRTVEFSLKSEFVELNQLLKLVGACDSGGAGKVLVAAGEVSVDGVGELRKTAKIRAGQVVRLGDMQVTVIAGDITPWPSEKMPSLAKPTPSGKTNPYQPGEKPKQKNAKSKSKP